MNEKIISIDEISEKEGWTYYAGYEVKTDRQTIKLVMDDEQSCCESFGYFMSHDDFSEFIGAELKDVSVTDTGLTHKKIEELQNDDECCILFVNLSTDRGVLQFVAYNSHNGYYGHIAKVISEQIKHEQVL
jgi:hypothetical protein